MDLIVGDLIFVRGDSWFAKMTNLVQTGKFGMDVPSHIGVISKVEGMNVSMIEAHFRGVRETSMDIYQKHKVWFGRMKEPREMEAGMIWLKNQIGMEYDFMQLLGILARSFFRLLGKKIYDRSKYVRNFLNSKQKFICSELVMLFGSITGKALYHHHFSQVTPFDLFRSEEINIYAEDA